MRKIYYIGFYDIPENKAENRIYSLSAVNKMDYIISSFSKLKIYTTIVSMTRTKNRQSYPARKIPLNDLTTLQLFFTYKNGGYFCRMVRTLLSDFILLKYFFLHIKKEDTVLVYHSLAYMRAVRLAKKIIRFNLVLEVEEIYGDVTGSGKTVQKEMAFFKRADAYIFPTNLLNQKLNAQNKPFTIVHGTYHTELNLGGHFNDGKTHCVYAGTFDPQKGGVASTISTAEFLSENYHIHILGFGTDEETKNILSAIDEMSNRAKCTITYDGLLSGADYIKFIQSCDIGLSTQNAKADFNDTSFPSKVLSYLANGLRVVSVRIRALETSAVNDLLYYYDDNSPEAIAQTIMSVDMTKEYDSRKYIQALDLNFQKNLDRLIRCLDNQ